MIVKSGYVPILVCEGCGDTWLGDDGPMFGSTLTALQRLAETSENPWVRRTRGGRDWHRQCWEDCRTVAPRYTAADLARAVSEAGSRIEERRTK